MKNRISQSVLLLIIVFFTGCSVFNAEIEKPAPQLAKEGMEYYEKGRFALAIKAFEKLRDWYPFSKYAILAELKIADSYYHLEDYEEAILAYENFESLHPQNEAIPYVIYQIGRCYFDRINTIDRDQTAALDALKEFQRLVKKFPSNPYAISAENHVMKCYQSIASHDFYIGVFYYKSRHYQAALNRFNTIIKNYPDTGVHQKALLYIANCEALIKEQKKN